MRLAIDLDGVVADFNAGWTTLYNADFGTDLTPDLVVEWNGMLGLTHFGSMREFWKWARNGDGPGLFRNLPVFPEALPALHRLSRRHDIVVVTAKPHWAGSETLAWIAETGIPTREVHITDDKWRVDCDIYLDDGPHILEQLVRERSDRTICRFVRAWNYPADGTVDIHHWDDFVTLVENRHG